MKRNSIFKNRNFTLLFAGILVSNIAHVLFNFAISLFVLRVAFEAYGQSQAALVQALYLAVSGFMLLLVMPLGGVIADKYNKIKTMYVTDYIRGVIILAVALILRFVDAPVMILYVLFGMNVILAINSAFFNPAGASLLRFIVDQEDLQQASSYIQGSANLQNIAGLILGGIIYATLGIFWVFIINGVGYIFSAVTEMFIRYNYKEHVSEGESISLALVFRDMKFGVKYIMNQKAIFAIIIMALSINFFFSPLFSNAIPYFIEFGLGNESTYLFDGIFEIETWYSLIMVSFSVASILMALYLSTKKTKERYGRHLKTAIAFAVCVATVKAGFMIAYYTEHISINTVLIALSITMFMIGLATMSFNIPISIIMQVRIDPKQLGRVSSVMSVMTQALVPFSALLAGIIISQFSIIYLYIFSVIGLFFVMVFYSRSKQAGNI